MSRFPQQYWASRQCFPNGQKIDEEDVKSFASVAGILCKVWNKRMDSTWELRIYEGADYVATTYPGEPVYEKPHGIDGEEFSYRGIRRQRDVGYFQVYNSDRGKQTVDLRASPFDVALKLFVVSILDEIRSAADLGFSSWMWHGLKPDNVVAQDVPGDVYQSSAIFSPVGNPAYWYEGDRTIDAAVSRLFFMSVPELIEAILDYPRVTFDDALWPTQ